MDNNSTDWKALLYEDAGVETMAVEERIRELERDKETIEDLLEKARNAQLRSLWRVYNQVMKDFLELIEGRCFAKKRRNNASFVVFKVTGYTEKKVGSGMSIDNRAAFNIETEGEYFIDADIQGPIIRKSNKGAKDTIWEDSRYEVLLGTEPPDSRGTIKFFTEDLYELDENTYNKIKDVHQRYLKDCARFWKENAKGFKKMEEFTFEPKPKENYLPYIERLQKMSIREIAREIYKEWDVSKIPYSCKPYLDAMSSMETLDGMYGSDSNFSIVLYALNEMSRFRGDKARAIKKVLNDRCKEKEKNKRLSRVVQ